MKVFKLIDIWRRFTEKHADKVVPHKFTARRLSDRSLLGLKDRVEYALNDNESIEIGSFD